MKKHLEYTNEKTSKFWKIEVVGKTHTVSYGKIKANGQTKTKEFTTPEAAIKDAEKLVKAKLKKGYFVLNQEEDTPEKWFDRLSHKIFTVYKVAILKYPIKEYKYIQLNWTGQGFALGLSPNPRDGYHEYIENGDWHNEDNTSLESEYRMLENIPFYEYDKEDDCEYEVAFERDEWPRDSSECFILESFLINVSLGLAYIKLEKDKDVKKYLSQMEVIKINSSDYELAPLIGAYGNVKSFPDERAQKNITLALLKNEEERQLVLDLCGKKATDTGITFLNHFKREVTKIKDMPKLSLQEAQKQAYDLELRFRNKEAIEVLKPVLKIALENKEEQDLKLLEKCCDVMGKASSDKNETIYWFQKGLEFVSNGHCALSLMSYYELDVDDDEALVAFCENHIQNIDIDDNVDHTMSCYRYLGRAYLALENKEKVITTYQKLFDYLIRMEQNWRLDYPIEDLEKFVKRQKRKNKYINKMKFEYKHANEILTWFKNPDAEID